MIINSSDFKVYFLIFILGGSLGNLFDRVYFKAVPDFIDIHHGDFHWFVFNVADIFITVGVICLILTELFINKDIKNENK
jgi:signal peptidase II